MCPEDDRGREADQKKFRVELVSLALTMRGTNARGTRLRKIREDTDPSLPRRVVGA